tara:strand:+ start:65 stop:325 length:261 start_codon:yes stop_codon:yes gene_type:complete
MSEIYAELPGLGPRNNQRVFYVASFVVLLNFAILTAICSYTASMTVEVNNVMSDLNELLPDARESLHIVKEMCKHENFTKTWGTIC